MYNLITRDFVSQHTEVARLIVEAAAPEKIYLLGCSISKVRTESIFNMDAPTARHVSHYYMLVLVNKKETDSCKRLQDKIENLCRSFIPVTTIVLNIDLFNEWLKEGHPFACNVKKIAECLHDTGNTSLTEPKVINEQEPSKVIEAYYNAGLNKVKEFLAGADLFRIRAQNKMAAFMLHQAAEHALHTLLKITTGLYINTHNIEKLIRYCSMVSYQLPAIFPRNNEKQIHLFKLLQSAYVHTRYKDDYIIRTDELLTLMERVRALEDILRDVYNSKRLCDLTR